MALLEVRTRSGVVRGVRANNPGYSVFKGIPYAAPPVGALRFAPPQEPEPWEGVRDCSRWGHSSIQEPGSFGFYQKEFYPAPKDMDEDCLYLNVWTGAESAEAAQPVFFWLHGGGFTGGYGNEMEFDGEAMCKRGCILVTINYRLGHFGFFAHPELTARFGTSGNAAVYDMIAALRWVHENIAAFGGDPENVTIFGQSAGGMAVRSLLTSPACSGLISRAIIQSGGGLGEMFPVRTMAEQEQLGVKLLQEAGLSLEELCVLPAQQVYEQLEAAGRKLSGGNPMGLGMGPCLDGQALVESPSDAIRRGALNTGSLMCGCVGGDAMLSGGNPWKPSADLAAHQAAAGTPIYVYDFDHNPPGDELGPFHSVELWYMFGTLHRAWRPWTGFDYALSDAMVDYWCAFARMGDPNVPGRESWPAYTSEAPLFMHFTDSGCKAEKLEAGESGTD